ncbi:protein of unknown function DUF198 [Ignisphaera aggregans DSM 17230]|uniref:GTP cyclohydrolase MptA n=1 Tax=Ignisphaera aggregans (strain DSM 17230 / JCM 13409 / AQ1.S1) TaxID=583356 RepID=E0SQQ7_IGNAA|nr:protein of unknown function DUF198 [Ignisphaera aggregans DSM 17230]
MELQDKEPTISIDIEMLGFKNVRRKLVLRTDKGSIALDADISLYVDVDSSRRGVHLSRTAEALLEVIEERYEAKTIEEYLDAMALKLLEKHEYIKRAIVNAKLTYYIEIEYHGIRGLEPIEIEVEVERLRNGERFWKLSVGVKGITVCPSAKESIASMLNQNIEIAPSHMQRVVLKGRIISRGNFIGIEKIARTLFNSVSAPTFTLLKRTQEAKLVLEAHKKPMFIEDVVREAIWNIGKEIKSFDKQTIIEVEVESYESIHPHNLYAYKKTTLEQLIELGL